MLQKTATKMTRIVHTLRRPWNAGTDKNKKGRKQRTGWRFV